MSAGAETWTLIQDLPGVGRAGDVVVHDPEHPNPRFRLAVVSPRDLSSLPLLRESLRRSGHHPGSAPSCGAPSLQLVED